MWSEILRYIIVLENMVRKGELYNMYWRMWSEWLRYMNIRKEDVTELVQNIAVCFPNNP